MGKGFNNYMTKKFFHPASKDNIKRVWMAQQKTTYEKKKQEDLMNQYQKEQEMLSNRALLGDEKAKLGLSFLYDAPPGMKKKEQEDDGEQEIKFEWQRKYNAPREAYAKNDETIRDQPFGIEVRNVRCIKCRQWGHVNTDKICPLFGRNLTAEPPQPENTTSSLLESLKEDGFQMKKSIMGRLMEGEDEKKVVDTDEDDPEVQFLKSLTPKQKKKLLKKLNKLQSRGSAVKSKKSKKEKKKKKKSKHASSDYESSDSEKRGRKKKLRTSKRKNADSDSESSSSDDSDDPRGAYSVRSRDVRPKETRPSKRGSPSSYQGHSIGERSRSPIHRSHDREALQRRSEPTRSRRDSSSEEDHKQDHRIRHHKHQSDHQRKGGKSQDNKQGRYQPSSSDSEDDRSHERSKKMKREYKQRFNSDSENEKYASRNGNSSRRGSKKQRSSSSDSEDERQVSKRRDVDGDRYRDRESGKVRRDVDEDRYDRDRSRKERRYERDDRRDRREERNEGRDRKRSRDRHCQV
ncbi:corepressor interacting with RBPJ 1-like isoform X1 [Haliotis cracherodii]|uniref:corepressor interacting with RBPJ 1-like isoform X1 n=1 Tax=Haliotis cracherodii TaxID=6455 RepID=UPI0039EA1508